jgi:hypothetical protein
MVGRWRRRVFVLKSGDVSLYHAWIDSNNLLLLLVPTVIAIAGEESFLFVVRVLFLVAVLRVLRVVFTVFFLFLFRRITVLVTIITPVPTVLLVLPRR